MMACRRCAQGAQPGSLAIGATMVESRTMSPSRVPQAVVFDLWDTLIPFPASARQRAEQAMADALGVPRVPFAETWAASFQERALGWSSRQALRAICPRIAAETPERIDDAAERRDELLAGLFEAEPSTLTALTDLRHRNLRIGLITDCGPESADLFRRSPLAKLVDAAVFSCEAGATKPDRLLYAHVALALGVAPAATVYVGDRPEELIGARSAGMTAVMLLGPNGRFGWSGATVDSLTDLPAVITRLSSLAAGGRGARDKGLPVR
jgi:putative hydrolase of the HAD superfamily